MKTIQVFKDKTQKKIDSNNEHHMVFYGPNVFLQ